MTIADTTRCPSPIARPASRLSPAVARAALAAAVVLGAAAGGLATGGTAGMAAVLAAGDDLTRLLRFMAAIKAGMAAGVVAAVLWRLGTTVTPGRLVAYGVACGAMSAGPGLIWGMAHVGLGAVLLHGGLLASGVLLWRDPGVALRLDEAFARRVRRRAALEARPAAGRPPTRG